MDHTPDMHIDAGFAPDEAGLVARLFWQAFRAKLTRILAPDDRAVDFIASVLNPDFALVARDNDGGILGLAGFKTQAGGLVGGGARDLARVYGWPGAFWRMPLLALLEREVEPGTLLMDGIFVAETARGRGVGTHLLHAIKSHAALMGLSAVRLDVIDSNPRAKALYLRQAFEPVGEEHLGPLRHIFGFRSATKMIWIAPNRP
ncbi:MAG: GNAT family N-acetyltransferase [Pseudomonadota bacterium]